MRQRVLKNNSANSLLDGGLFKPAPRSNFAVDFLAMHLEEKKVNYFVFNTRGIERLLKLEVIPTIHLCKRILSNPFRAVAINKRWN